MPEAACRAAAPRVNSKPDVVTVEVDQHLELSWANIPSRLEIRSAARKEQSAYAIKVAVALKAPGNAALTRAIEMHNRLPFAAASAMLPMQSALQEGRNWLFMARQQHHSLVQAMEKGEGARAQASEHVQIAQMNLAYALESPELCKKLAAGLRMVADAVL